MRYIVGIAMNFKTYRYPKLLTAHLVELLAVSVQGFTPICVNEVAERGWIALKSEAHQINAKPFKMQEPLRVGCMTMPVSFNTPRWCWQRPYNGFCYCTARNVSK